MKAASADPQKVGITEYSCADTPALTGKVKERYTDFFVNEIDEAGVIVRIDKETLKAPSDDSGELQTQCGEATDVPTEPNWDEATKSLQEFLGDNDCERLVSHAKLLCPLYLGRKEQQRKRKVPAQLMEAAGDEAKGSDSTKPQEEDSQPAEISNEQKAEQHELIKQELKLVLPGNDKELRTRFHEAVREHFPFIHTVTDGNTDDNSGKIINAKADLNGKNRAKRSRNMNQWPFTKFVLEKENLDWHFAQTTIAKTLGVKSSVINSAGTKDKRGVTSQWCTAFRIPEKRMRYAATKLRNMRIGNFQRSETALKLGDLNGNHFRIVLRDVQQPREDIDKCMEAFRTNGFLNYFGLQRFGMGGATFEVGIAALKADWAGVIDEMMKCRQGEKEEVVSARRAWLHDRDAKKALEGLPRSYVAERLIMETLKKQGPNSYQNAFQMVPRNLRTMYAHAVQSLVFNHALSFRVRTHGLKVVEGDLVLLSCGGKKGSAPHAAKVKSPKQSGGAPPSPNLQSQNKSQIRVEKVSSSDIEMFSIEDVVLPLPGNDVEFPDNDVGEFMKKYIEDLGVSFTSSKIKEYNLSGAYRRILCRAEDLSWDVVRYNDAETQLQSTDKDVDNGISMPSGVVNDGKFQALRVAFSLPPSGYATMAFREMLKGNNNAAFE